MQNGYHAQGAIICHDPMRNLRSIRAVELASEHFGAILCRLKQSVSAAEKRAQNQQPGGPRDVVVNGDE